MSSLSSWSRAAECWSSAEEAVRIANAPVIVSMDTEFWWLFYVMWMTAAYLVLSFGAPLFSFLSSVRLPRLLSWLRSGVRSLDVVERFEMETRLQVQRGTLDAEQKRRFDEYIVDFENRVAILDSELEAERQLSKQLQIDKTSVRLAHAREIHQVRRSMDVDFRILETRVNNANARSRVLEKAMGGHRICEAESASHRAAHRLPEEQRLTNADALFDKLACVKQLYNGLREASADILRENETLKSLVPKWKPFRGSVYVNELSNDETMGKLDPPGTGYRATGAEVYPIIAPKIEDDSQNDYPQAPPEEPFSTPPEPILLPNDSTFASPQVAGTTPLGDKFMIGSMVQWEVWQWLNKYCDEKYGLIFNDKNRWATLTYTLGAKIEESSLPGPNMQPETILEPSRRLHAKLYRALTQYCGMYYKEILVLDKGSPFVPLGDNAIVEDDHPIQPARRPNGPEHVPSVPGAWNSPPTNYATVSEEVEEMVHGTGGSNEPTSLPTIPEQFPDSMGSGHLIYPQLDGNSSGQSEGFSYPNLPEMTPNPSGISYGLDPSHLAVESNRPTLSMTLQVDKPRLQWMGALSSPVLERLQDPGDHKHREPDVPGDANPDMSLASSFTKPLRPSILPGNLVETATTWASVPFDRTETGPQRLEIDRSRETEGIAQPRAGEVVTTSLTQLSDELVAGSQVVSVVETPLIEPVDEDMEKQVTLQSDTVMTMYPSVSETISARCPRYRSVNQITNNVNQCQLDDEIYMKILKVAENSIADEPLRWQPETETAAMVESSGYGIRASDIMMTTQTSTNTDIANQVDIPMTMSTEEEGPVTETSKEMVEENGLSAISDSKDEITCSETHTGMATEVTATVVLAPKDEAIIVETLPNMTEQEPIPKTTTPQASCLTAENSTSLDHVAAVMTRRDDASNATVRMIIEYESAQISEELAVERSPLMDISTTNAVDQRTEDLASRPPEPSISDSNLPNLPGEMVTTTDQVAEKPEDNLALKSTARPVATPIPFAQRRKIPSTAPKPASSLVKLALQPMLANNVAATRPSSGVEEQESLSPQLTANRPEKLITASLPGSITKLQPQLGLARRPKKPVDPFIRKKPARKTQDGTGAQINARATTTGSLSEHLLTQKITADEISTKRGASESLRQEVHDSIEDTSSKNSQSREAPTYKNLVIEDPKTSKDDINNKRARTSLLLSSSIASTLESKQTCSADQASNAPALFEDRALEAVQMWTPLHGLTEDQVIKQVSEWLVTDTHFYEKVDECTMMRNFGAFAGFDFEKLLKQCHWTTTWLNEQNMTGNNEILFEKTQLKRTTDYVQKLCAACLEGKVKNRKDGGKSNGDRIEVVTRINGMECRGYRALTKEEKRVRDEELDNGKAVDVENVRALMKWAESVLILGRAAQKSDKL
ncbi:hypothetical protein MMC27_000114 [Xylographa pallens]|nr:hypothetical protein [Xylographa pallens]